jgi:hypothetical protein
VFAASLPEWTDLVNVVVWPLVVLIALWFAWSDRGRRLLRPVLRRVRKVAGAGFALELSEENARSTKADVEGGLADYAKVLNTELDRLTHLHDVRAALEEVVDKAVDHKEPTPKDYRATVHIRDPLIGDALHQLLNYYPRGTGAHRRWSTRFGILGRCWRLRDSIYEPRVPEDDARLIVEWGMTKEQAKEAGSGRQSFMCRLLVPPNSRDARVKVPEMTGVPVGVLYLDAKKEGAFGDVANDFAFLDGLGTEVARLAVAVAAVDEGIRSLGPSIKVLDSD